MWIKEMFNVEKPIIAMLHLKPLPGDPFYKHGDSMVQVVKQAKHDLIALQEGGVDGVLISNEFSLPYQRHMSFVTPAAMARVIGELMSEIRVPFGVDCISDGLATIELAAAVNADFVRGTFSGVYVGDGGFYNNDFSHLLRRKAELHLDDLKMLYFLNPESDMNLDVRELKDIAKSLAFKAQPAGFCISASAAGEEVSSNLMRSVRDEIENVAVFCNTGIRKNTVIDKLNDSDGGIVGTTFKKDGDFYKEVDTNRVKELMEIVKEYRKRL